MQQKQFFYHLVFGKAQNLRLELRGRGDTHYSVSPWSSNLIEMNEAVPSIIASQHHFLNVNRSKQFRSRRKGSNEFELNEQGLK